MPVTPSTRVSHYAISTALKKPALFRARAFRFSFSRLGSKGTVDFDRTFALWIIQGINRARAIAM